ncbi:MAG: mechanosensitive ion channel domain-containing protein [Bdellovibrionales bacterium]
MILTLWLGAFADAQSSETLTVPKSVSDASVQSRIERLFAATGWFPELKVKVAEGLVFLDGKIDSKEHQDWALEVIKKTEGVVAVIDHSELSLDSSRIVSPATAEISDLWKKAGRYLPYLASAILILVFSILAAIGVRLLVFKVMGRRGGKVLLAQAVANVAMVVVGLVGLYLALRSSGLTGLAFTVLGGTGFLGIGIGLALKSTFENYASALMISLRELFRRGEIVRINDYEGVVQSVTTRGTTLMDYEGNNVIIPNSLVFGSVIKNLTRNPNMRSDFKVGIGYDDDIDLARATILAVLKDLKEFVLADPESIVSVDELGSATVNLRVYFWFDAVKYSPIKVRSLVMQKVKEGLMAAHVSMPDDAREVIFASSLKVENVSSHPDKIPDKPKPKTADVDLKTSRGMENEINQLREQATKSESAEKGENLLEP